MSLAGMSEHPDFHEKAGSGTLDEEASTTSHQVDRLYQISGRPRSI